MYFIPDENISILDKKKKTSLVNETFSTISTLRAKRMYCNVERSEKHLILPMFLDTLHIKQCALCYPDVRLINIFIMVVEFFDRLINSARNYRRVKSFPKRPTVSYMHIARRAPIERIPR